MCTPSTPRFFFNDTAATEIYTLSLHDALPIFGKARLVGHTQELCALRRAQRVLGSSTDRPRPSIALDQPLLGFRSEEHTSELQSRPHLVCRLLLEKKKTTARSELSVLR